MNYRSIHFPLRVGAFCALTYCGAPGAIALAHATYTLTYAQVGANVVATGSGSIDTTDLTNLSTFNEPALIDPSIGLELTGPTSARSGIDWFGLNGPTEFGTGATTAASSGSGETIGAQGSFILGSYLLIESGYVSGAALSDTATWDNATFSSLGMTPGTYVWTWGIGAHADSFQIQVGLALPEPSTTLLSAAPLMLLLRRRRKHLLAR